MNQTIDQNAARGQIFEALALAGDVVETCELAVELLAAHEPIGGVVMLRSDIAKTIINGLQTGDSGLREALDGVCEQLERLPARKDTSVGALPTTRLCLSRNGSRSGRERVNSSPLPNRRPRSFGLGPCENSYSAGKILTSNRSRQAGDKSSTFRCRFHTRFHLTSATRLSG